MARRKNVSALLAMTMLAGATMFGVLATPAQAALRHLDGTVLSKNVSAKTFQIRTQNGNQARVRVNGNTVFQRIAGGFGGLKKGMRVEVEAKQTSNGLLAKHVEPKESGGGEGGGGGAGGGGGGGGGGADDPANHG